MKNMAKNRKEKWRNVSLNQLNIDAYLVDLIEETKGQYITQGVSFNKDDSYQMGLLRQAILDHSSFSGLVKHLLTLYFSGQPVQPPNIHAQQAITAPTPIREFYAPVQEHKPEPTPQVVDTVVAQELKPNAPKQRSSTKSLSTPARRVGNGGAFLKTNPNARPPKDPSTT